MPVKIVWRKCYGPAAAPPRFRVFGAGRFPATDPLTRVSDRPSARQPAQHTSTSPPSGLHRHRITGWCPGPRISAADQTSGSPMDRRMTGSDLLALAPWAAFAAGLAVVCLRLRQAIRAARGPSPRPARVRRTGGSAGAVRRFLRRPLGAARRRRRSRDKPGPADRVPMQEGQQQGRVEDQVNQGTRDDTWPQPSP